jgi:8-oxo-dGTP diphosphatase
MPQSRSYLTIDLVILTPAGDQLTVFLCRSGTGRGRPRWELPWTSLRNAESLDAAAERLARSVLGEAPLWVAQASAFGGSGRGADDPELSIAYVALAPASVDELEGGEWFSIDDLPATLLARQRPMIEAAVRAVRDRTDHAPVAFHLLPAEFTLSELQSIYEMLLGRRLHKASFRRTLLAAQVVAATRNWRREGRGRPARLFRYAPKRRRSAARGVRFDLFKS